MNLGEFRRILRQTLFVPVALLLLLAVFFLLQLARFSKALGALDHSDQITSRIIELQKLILDQETGLRGYELNNDPVMLAPYTAGIAPIQQDFAVLKTALISGLRRNVFASARLPTTTRAVIVPDARNASGASKPSMRLSASTSSWW